MAIDTNADFTPTIPDSGVVPVKSPYNPTGSFKFWAQKVLPLVYDDSLSYYEVLCKVVNYLNNVIQNVDNLNDSVNSTNQSFETLKGYVNTTKDTLINTYNKLQEYVNTYFDHLDVQQEINAKLDAMADSGELTNLLAPFIPNLVTQWLNNHVTPTSPIIDNTLSISGAGADAKVTGDKFTELKSALSEIYIHKEYENTAGKGGQVTFAFTGKAGQTLRIVNGEEPVQVQTRATQSGSTVQEIYVPANQTKELVITTGFEYLHLYYSGNSITDFYIVETALTKLDDNVTEILTKYIKNQYCVMNKTDLPDFDNAPNNSIGFVFLPLSTPVADLPAHYPDSSVIQGYGLLFTLYAHGYETAKLQMYISAFSGRRYSRQYSGDGWTSWIKNLDTTLTQQYFCADAKAVGDAIDNVNANIGNTIRNAGFIDRTNLVNALHPGQYAIAFNIGDAVRFGENDRYAYGRATVAGLEYVTINLSNMSDTFSFFTDSASKKVAASADQRVGTSRVYAVPNGAKYMYISTTYASQYGIVVFSGSEDIVTNPVSAVNYPYGKSIYVADNLKLTNGMKISDLLSSGPVYHVEKDGSGDFTKLVDAIQEATQYMNAVVYVGAGTWDIVDEFGETYMESVSSNPTTWGLELKNNVHVIGTAKTIIQAHYTGTTQNTREYFSVFNAGAYGFTLENVKIDADNIRYVIHDDRGSGGSTPYVNKYINCDMKLTNGYYGDTVIGGGLGINGTIEIRNCRFEGRTHRLAYYHGNNYRGETGAKCTIIVQGCYFAGDGSFDVTKYGDSTEMSTAYLSNNSFGSAPQVTSGSYAPQDNMQIVAWNNVIRDT